jgi:dynein heavy chain
MKYFISVDHPTLIIGSSGCGKTQIAKGLIRDLSDSDPSAY